MLFCCSKEEDKCRLRQLHMNWFLTQLIGINMSVSFIMPFPTLHNFLVNPKNESCENPGLGESETVYSVAAGSTNAGGIVGILLVVFLAERLFSYKALLISLPTVTAIGYLIYGLSNAGWMVIVGRFCIGASGASVVAIVMSYYVSSSKEYNSLCKKIGKPQKLRLKRQLIVMFSFVSTVSYIPAIGLVVLVGQFPAVDQFRWIGWFISSFAIIIALLVVVFFRGEVHTCTISMKSKPMFSKTFEKQSVSYISATLIIFLVYTGCMIDASLKLVEALTSPILSDYFGFKVHQITFFIFGASAIFPLSCFILIILEKLRLSSRAVILLALLLNTSGLFALSDWQSIRNDPCKNYSIADHVESNQCVAESSCVQIDISCPDYIVDIIYQSPIADTTSIIDDDCLECFDELNCTSYRFQLNDYTLCLMGDVKGRLSTDAVNHLRFYNSYQIGNQALCISANSKKIQKETNRNNTFENIELNLALIIESINDLLNGRNSEAQQKCESNDMCYWNPDSVLTGDYCYECPPICRSRKGSLHFLQVCLAIILLTLSIDFSRYTLLPLMSKVAPPRLKLVSTSLLVLMQNFTKVVTPIWFNTLYVGVGRHTLIPSALLLALQIPVYIGYILLCSRLSSKYQNVNNKVHRPSVTTLVSEELDIGKQDAENANNMLSISDVLPKDNNQEENIKDSLNKQLETVVKNSTVDATF